MSALSSKPYCTISVDVDSLDSILRFHGQSPSIAYRANDPIYEKVLPRFLRLFSEHGVKATFFVVASDCSSPSKQTMLQRVIDEGHEIANHSLNHAFGFSLLPRKEKEKDIFESTRIIEEACGQRPSGFRVPGYDIDEVTIDILDRAGYLYDSSVYKFFAYPALRKFSYIRSGHILKRDALKGLASEFLPTLLPPLKAYFPKRGKFWRAGYGRDILEIPISVIPFFNLPFNSTFLFIFGARLFDFGFWMTGKRDLNLNYNFHPADMLDSVRDKIFVKQPGLSVALDTKRRLFHRILGKIEKRYSFVTLKTFANTIKRSKGNLQERVGKP
ncbi:MAG: polysaccharide deacetylase family protein [Candidatus Omnitrophota bacterium]